MLVPDQSHINQVRDALWQRFGGGASVMVGSGFSKHALKTRPDAEDPPLWRDVVEKMSCELYPKGTNGTPATDGHLRIAQEYETAVGRNKLHHFIRQTVRDNDFNPGDVRDVHPRLLRLPWRDVFTTNWDTLLERTRISILERAYSVVTNMDEIPLASRPRIIKLHGSLPAQFPLICTEEDYRTYPTKFAPFVNTVQQAMMETVFCLIGFSGDDPNFLQWSGWVRDNLGDAAPKIYLAGWLNLSPHRRRMLEDRNVVPVDLARHPQAGSWPEHLRHDRATEWILHTLELGCPYDVTNWPSPNVQAPPKLPTHLEPVEVVTFDTPQKESWPVSSSNEPENNEKSVRKVLEVWAHNRKIYPGWLIAPNSVQIGLSLKIREWEPHVLHAAPNFEPVERLYAIRELIWRQELLLEPVSSELESAAEESLKLINCENRMLNGVADPNIEWAAVREAWRNVALALVTVARHRFDRDTFDQRLDALSPFLQDAPDVDHRTRHERCLWAVYAMDFETLNGLLEDWQVENSDPAWMMRKAALLFETGQYDKAVKLVKDALAAIRTMPADDRSLARPSREGWALWLVLGFESYQNRQMIFKKWHELTLLECNAFMEKQHVTDAVKSKEETGNPPPFDLGMQWSVLWPSFSDENPQASPYRTIRLSEVAGLPPFIESVEVAKGIFSLAAEKLCASDPKMAVCLVLRACTYNQDKTIGYVLSRTRVAALPKDSAKTLAEICSGMIEYTLPRMGRPDPGTFWIKRMQVAMEVLSRLVLRLESDKAETLLDKALEFYRNQLIAKEPFMTGPVYSLLKRSWEALPKERRNARILDLLGAPIVGLDGFEAWSDKYPDPGDLLQNKLLVFTRACDDEGRWQEIVSLLVHGLRAGGEARKRAACRIASIALLKQEPLTEAEQSRIAEALWHDDYTDVGKRLPGQTTLHRELRWLYDWVFLLMPQPRPGIAEQCFRTKWLVPNRMPQEDAPSPHDILWQVGRAITGLKIHQQPLVLSEDEQSYLIEAIEQWLNTPIPDHVDPFFHGDPLLDAQLHEPTLHAIDGLRSILTEVQIPEAIGEKLHTRIQALNESNIPGFVLIAGLVAGLVKALPDRLAELALSMRMKLASENENIASGAVTGLHHWLMISAENTPQIHPPPDDLIREIGVIIANRRKASLASSLQAAKWVFDEGNDEQKKTIHNLVLQGLGYLVEELRYDRDHDLNDDVPLLRWCSVQLALSMAEHGSKDAPAVSRWLEIAENDPLPEVRYAKHSAITRESW